MPVKSKAPKAKVAPKKGQRLYEDGGETITVQVLLNNKLKYTRSATITGNNANQQVRRYTLDDGTTINHNRLQGFLKLVKKIIDRDS